MKSSFEQALINLKEKGVRLTPQRQMILEYLKEFEGHPTAVEVQRGVNQNFVGPGNGISLATVYNSLSKLTELGVIGELDNGRNGTRYDGNDSQHAHLICTQCGDIHDIDLPPSHVLQTKEVIGTGFDVASHRLDYYGICSNCRESSQAS